MANSNSFKSVALLSKPHSHSVAMLQSAYFLIFCYLNSHHDSFLRNLGLEMITGISKQA